MSDQHIPKDVGHFLGNGIFSFIFFQKVTNHFFWLSFLGFIEELSSVKMASVGEIPQGHNTNPPVSRLSVDLIRELYFK